MADEEIIYLSPEEELTSVRERLQRIQARRIILVIPAQTQLRSHVSWRLLHARARELNKEILIVSSDRQIRSVVKAAGFKVADSLESSPTGSRTRPPSRPGRMGLGGRTAARLRTPPGRSLPEQQRGRPGVRSPYQAPQQYNEPGLQPGQQTRRDAADAEEDTLELAPPASSTFGIDDKEFGTDIDYHIGSTASIRPVVPPYDDEEPDLFLEEDYQRSQSIRKAAAHKQKYDTSAMMPPENIASSDAISRIYDLPSTPHEAEEPFTYLEEVQSAPLPEQHASIPMASIPSNEINDKVAKPAREAGNPPDKVPDITDYPTDIIQVEDEGDLGDFVDHSGSSSRTWDVPAPGEDQESGPSLVHGVRPRTNRTGKTLSPQPPPDFDDDELPPIYDQQSRVSPPPSTKRPSGTLPGEQVKPPSSPVGMGNRSPQPVTLPPSRNQAKTAQRSLKKRPARGSTPTGTMPRPARPLAGSPSQRAGQKRGSSSVAVPLFIVILGLLIIGLLAFFVPAADVTVTLPSQSFSLPTKLTATASSRQDVAHKTLPAQMLTFNTSVTGPGHATGTITLGTKAATGIVTFTNTGNSSILIPTGTIVATQSGVQFATTAETLVLASPNTNIAPIQAQNPGASGNVPANAINTIPSSSNSGLNTAALAVTNPNPTTGGGAGNATSVSTSDVNAEKAVLDQQLQAQIKDFLKKNVHAGDQQGKLLETETPITTPAVGKVDTDGTFTETLKLNMKVLVVRAADLQAAATAQLKDALSRQRTGLALVPQQNVELKQVKPQSSKDGATLAISFTAVGQVAPQISEDTVRSLVSGKSIEEAKLALVGRSGIPNAVDPQITVYPGFIHWLPFWQPRINVHFKTLPARQTPVPKHGKS